MKDVSFAGQMTQREYLLMNNLLFRRFWIGFGVAFVAVLALDLAVFSHLVQPPLFLVVGVVIALGLFLLQQWNGRRVWVSNTLMHMPVYGVVSEKAITWNVLGVSESRFSWEVLLHYRASESMVLVHTSLNQVLHFMPGYFPTAHEWVGFRTLVARRLPCKK